MDYAHDIARLTNDFYEKHAQSFSRTRQDAWEGWQRLGNHLERGPITVMDIACGNLRFERFLDQEGFSGVAYGIDACASLLNEEAPESFTVFRRQTDIIHLLAQGDSLESLQLPFCSLTACFGFMHHVPTEELRMRLMDQLVRITKPGGLCVVSLWRFMQDERLVNKARSVTDHARRDRGIVLDAHGDAFLDWQGDSQTLRFCHSFTDAEADRLVQKAEDAGSCLLDDFTADGRTGSMNRYLIFRRS